MEIYLSSDVGYCAVANGKQIVEGCGSIDEAQREAEKILNPVNYNLKNMPNGFMVGDVCMLTSKVAELLEGTKEPDENARFCEVEKLIREHVWKTAQEAHYNGVMQSPDVSEVENASK